MEILNNLPKILPVATTDKNGAMSKEQAAQLAANTVAISQLQEQIQSLSSIVELQ